MPDLVETLKAALADRYTLDRELGRGGMATVYLARDVRHARQVAIKVLHPELAAVLGAERFLAEIKTTANLQHPHILPLFDSGSADGQLFYVMPFVEGETLRGRLDRETQLPIDDAVRIAREVADALQYAHERGVIHRDIKPENILLQGGHALVADFGIALAVQHAGGQRMTQTGLSLGTPHYMAPEQAMGDKAVDARADIYALGAVTYEMLAGEPPFTGPTAQAIIARVLTGVAAPLSASRATVPELVDAAVMTALAKLPADRFMSAADFAAAIAGQRSVSMPGGTRQASANANANARATHVSRIRARELLAWTAMVTAVGVAIWLGTRTPPASWLGQFEVVLPDSVGISNLSSGNRVAISRDGSLLAFSAKTLNSPRTLFVRSADNSTSHVVKGAENVAFPTISPDNKWLLYSSPFSQQLMKIPVSGGTPVTLVTGIGSSTSSSWGDDNRIIYTRGPELWLTNAEGDSPRRLVAPDTAAGIQAIHQPEILPGSTHALVTLLRGKATLPDSAELAIVSLGDGAVVPLGVRGFSPHFAAPGYVLFGRPGGMVYAAPFSLRKRGVTGSAVRIVENLMFDFATTAMLSVAQNGWLVYESQIAAPTTSVVVVDQRGTERVLPFVPRAYADPSPSPDGRRLAVRISGGLFNSGNIWIHDLQNGSVSRFTSDSSSYRPTWSRDGRQILYVNGKAAETRIISRPWDGSGADSVLLKRFSLAEIAPGPIGGFSAIRTIDGPRDIYLAPTDSLSSLKPFVTGPADETNPRVSPDGKWLAYQSNEIGAPEVYLRPIPGPGARIPVSVGGGILPRWSPDGRTIYYRSPSHIMAARLATQGQMEVVRRDALFSDVYIQEGEGQGWDVFPNGKEFVFLKGLPTAPPKIKVLVNWQQLIKRTGNTVVER